MPKKTLFTKQNILRRLLLYQAAGYGALLFLIVGDEAFDFPHTIFGQLSTPVNWAEVTVEGTYIILLGFLSLLSTWYLVKRIKFFEGLIPICSFCKKIRDNDRWMLLEEYVDKHSEAMLSHGLCPDCKRQHYGTFPHNS